MKVSAFVTCAFAILVAGCASIETIEEAKDQGVSRIYQYAYEPVFNATLAAAKTKKLKVIDLNKRLGRIDLSHGISLWSWGERISVFFKAVTPQATEVVIVNKPVLSPLTFPPDWPQILLEQIEVKLRTEKQPP